MWEGRFCPLGVVFLKNRKLASFLRSPWIIAIFPPLIVYIIISIAASIINSINLYAAFLLILKWTWILILSFFTFRIPVWIIISVLFIVFILVRLITTRKKKPDEPWKQYKMDYFEKLLFEWEYNDRNTIINLEPVCKKCKCQLSSSNKSHFRDLNRHLYCPNCGIEYKSLRRGIKDDFKKVINKRIQSGECKNSRYFKK